MFTFESESRKRLDFLLEHLPNHRERNLDAGSRGSESWADDLIRDSFTRRPDDSTSAFRRRAFVTSRGRCFPRLRPFLRSVGFQCPDGFARRDRALHTR